MGKEITSAKVLKQDGMFVREYTLKRHGKKFMELAKEFATKNSYFVEGIEATTTPEATPEAPKGEDGELVLSELSFNELKALADENDIGYKGIKSKSGLIELLEK